MMQPAEQRMPMERLVEHLSTVLLGAAQASLLVLDLVLDPDAVIGAEHLIRLARSEGPRSEGNGHARQRTHGG